jgi:eukaryotic-like serine/threonine-protein kinase
MARGTTDGELRRELEGTAYRFVRTLSGGAMGEVVLVEHAGLGETRVMKLLRSHLANVEDLATRLRTEARVLTKLDHENLVRVVDFGRTQSGRPFLVMDHLRGRTLKELVQELGALPVHEAVELTRQILRGLAEVHNAGIIHRDLKPDNVFVCGPDGATAAELASAGRVKILDFGIVKVVTDHDRARLGHVPPTEEGMLVGTPAYLSPEQALAQTVTPAADLYAVGGILGHLVTGEAPFRGTSQLELLRAHVMEPPVPPSARVPSAAPVDAVVLHALRKKPEERFQSTAQFLRALEELRLEPPSTGTGTEIAPVDQTVLLPAPAASAGVRDALATARSALTAPHKHAPAVVAIRHGDEGRPLPVPELPARRWRWAIVLVLIALLAALVVVLAAILLAGPTGARP